MTDIIIDDSQVNLDANYSVWDNQTVAFANKHIDEIDTMIIDGINRGMSFQQIMFAIERELYRRSTYISVLLNQKQRELKAKKGEKESKSFYPEGTEIPDSHEEIMKDRVKDNYNHQRLRSMIIK